MDEYDKPILDALEVPDVARANRDFLRGLYAVIKDCDADIRFALITGVSRFSKVSLISGLNNLVDLTLDPRYSAICGYTEADLNEAFAPELPGLDRNETGTPKFLTELAQIKTRGYAFRALMPVLHGAGLRTGQAVRLSVRDVGFRDAALPPRNTIFFGKRLLGVPMRCGPAMCVARNAQCRGGPLRLVSRTGTERRLPMPRPRDHSAAWASWPSLSARDQCRSKRSSVITFAHAATKSCKNVSCASSPA